ncbi:multiple epidermal growth factor-like domains protein 10 [Crassostrea angulata]|uniref:multiple epidermal growth factor-like domains protein 10 n=1 Tax=Magallana angulata TaxID=2784310 RepID=UPI0022B19B3B|nr:multiple epidermal growth factor-like domains protein 10 [Crassostrea angulata]
MQTVLWTFFALVGTCVYCYENLSRRSATIISVSSIFESYTTSNANDGNLNTTYIFCSHTDLNQTKAWLQVDLGKPYSINHVKIYYRKDDYGLYWKQYRFRQFYLDVSNISATQSSTTQRIRCYKDNTTAPSLPPYIIDIPCKQTVRYVIVETTYDAPEDDKYGVHGAILEVCEIEVYGCNKNCINQVCDPFGFCIQGCVDGYWGHFCDSVCHVDCKEPSCNRTTGHCITCISGFWGDTCTIQCSSFCYGGVCGKNNGYCAQGCTPGRFGEICVQICSSGCKNGTCDQKTGICLYGCKQNWSGDYCNICESTRYGPTCSLECADSCVNSTCNNYTGSCMYGCQEGFYGDQCDRDCYSCPTGCDRITGECIGDCPVGRFGKLCNKPCSKDCKNRCNKNTGSCEEGCVFGNIGDFCNETCDDRCLSCCDSKTDNIKPRQDSCTENLSILIGVCVILCISVLVNGCTITWILRQTGCKQRGVTQQRTKGDSHSNDFVSQQGIHYTAEDNAGYQELGQVSGPSHYDQLQRSQ